MGIKGLMQLIQKIAPKAITVIKTQTLASRVVALDVSNWIYQFLAKTRSINTKNNNVYVPMDSMGNQTGHLIGLMSRINYCLSVGIKPIFVFDGVPPQEKFNQLKRRKLLKQQAQQQIEQALEKGEPVDLLKMSQKSVTFSRTQKQDAQKMIQLMGLPVIKSPSQAQPQCTELVKSGIAYGTISQDLDTMAFGCPIMIKDFNEYSNKERICHEISLQVLLKQLKVDYDQFVDICILCGCDYSSKIKNIGPMKALQYIKKYGDIDKLLQQIAENQKFSLRHTYDDTFNHFACRNIFKQPVVRKYKKQDIKFNNIKQQQLRQFFKQKQFQQGRVQKWLNVLKQTNYYKQIQQQ